MTHALGGLSPATCLAALVVAGTIAGPAAAADWQQTYFEPAVQAWMGVVTLLADEGDVCSECEKGDCEACRGDRAAAGGDRRRHGDQRPSRGDRPHRPRHAGAAHRQHHKPGDMHPPAPPRHARMGPPRPEGPRGDALAMLGDILGRVSRIEAMLAGRGPMPGRGPRGDEARGPRREAAAEMRNMMEDRMAEGRERMEQARTRMEEARRRFRDMEQRVKRLEAEVKRLKEAAAQDD